MTSKASFYEKLFFLIVASFGPAREVKEKIAPETFFNGFWPVPYTYACKLANKTFLGHF